MPTDPEQARFLAAARLRRHGWDRVEADNRRTAERLARRLAREEIDLDDAHAGCIEPHRDADGDYVDCTGTPL